MRIIRILFVVLIGGMFACQDGKYENVFGEAPVERRNAYFEQLRTTLTGAENGWNMQYFPVENGPGYNLYASFSESGEAVLGAKTVYTGNVYREYASSYSLTADNGPALVFTTYNHALHPFADPDINLSTLADFEFIVFDLKDDTVLLKGKWMKTDVRLIRLPAGMTGEEYVRRAEEMKQLLFAKGSPELILDVEEASYSFSEENTSILKIRAVGADTAVTTPYITTADGFRLYKSMEAGGKKLQNFRLVDDGLICTDPGVNARFRPAADDICEFFLNSLASTGHIWKIDPNSLGGVFAEAYAQIASNCKEKYKEDFESLFFAYKTPRRGITLSFKSVGKNEYEGAFNFGIAQKEGTANQIVFTNKNSADTNGSLYLKNIPGFDVFLNELETGSYTVSTESAMSVSVIKFTRLSNPDNWFQVLLNL